VAVLYKVLTVFACSNTGVAGSNPTRGTDVYVYSVFLLSCVSSDLEGGSSPAQGDLPTVYMIKKL
jgi:hypothetical protein